MLRTVACLLGEIKATIPRMLTSSFIFLPGVRPVTERRWWQESLFDWRRFLGRSSIAGLSTHRKIWYDEELREAQSLTEKRHVHMFDSRFSRREHTTISSLDRLDAVRLWFQWRRGDRIAHDTLLSYNRTDTESLVLLADRFYYEDMVPRFGPSSLSTTLHPVYSQ